MSDRTFDLPAGLIGSDGRHHREVEIEPLSGRDEETLAGERGSPAALVTSLLARCTRRIGGLEPTTKENARSLLVADRQYLLLQLRAVTFGPEVNADLPCPWPGCGARFSLNFSVHDIPVEVPVAVQQAYEFSLPREAQFTLPDGRNCTGLRYRLPNGSDQEAVAELAKVRDARASEALLARCLLDHADSNAVVDALPASTRSLIEAEIARVAPRLETTLETHCPECSRVVGVPLDIQDFFFGDLQISSDLLRREVHYLAYHYHWSESEIMGMPRERRRDYIRVLADEIERLNDAI